MKRDAGKAQMLECLSRNPIVEAACAKTRVGRTTFYRWMREDPDYAKAVDAAIVEGREFISDAAESRLIMAIQKNQLPAIQFWLRGNHPQYRNRVEIEGRMNIIESLSPEQRALVEEALSRSMRALPPVPKMGGDKSPNTEQSNRP